MDTVKGLIVYNLTSPPPYVPRTDENKSDKRLNKWSGGIPLPAIGDRVKVNMNSLGFGIVTGYFVEHSYLGLYVKLENAPEWFTKQNKDRERNDAMIFGIDLT